MRQILLTLFLFFLYGASPAQDEIEQLINNNRKSNTRLDRSLAIDTRKNMDVQTIQAKLEQQQKTTPNYIKDIDKVFEKYDDRRENNDVGMWILKGNHQLIKTAMLCWGSNAKIPLLCDITEKGLDKVESLVQSQMDADARRVLKTGLDRVMQVAGQSEVRKIVNSKKPQEFLDAMKPYSDIMAGMYNNIPNATAEDRQLVLAAMLKTVGKEIETGFKQVDAAQRLTNQELQQTSKNIAALSICFIKFAEKNMRRLDTIIRVQNEIKNQLVDINNRLGNTERGIQFLQQYFFGQMSPKDQINVLKLGMVPGISEEKRMELIQQITLYQKQQQLNQSIQGFLQGASEMVAIAANFGLDGKIVQKLNVAVSFGTNAFNAFTALQSGNFIGSIGAISKIFGFGGPDIAAQRHQEIMQALNTIYQKLEVIDKKLDFLIKGQEQIIKNQQKIFEALVTISKQIDRNHKEVREKLEAIHQDVTYNGLLIRGYVKTQYTNCYRMIVTDATQPDADTIISTEKNIFPSYRDLEDYCRNWESNGDIRGCFDIISQVRKLDLTFDHPIFNLRSSSNPENYNWVRRFIDTIHQPSIFFINADTTLKGLTIGNKRTSLFVPSLTVRGLEKKLTHIKESAKDISSRFSSPTVPNAFEQNLASPLWYEAVEQHINFILDIHYYRMVLNRTENKPVSRAQLFTANVNTTGYQDLKNGLALTDFAIAQQNLYSGDVLLPILANILDNTDTLATPQRTAALNLINSSSILAKNFLTYKLRNEILDKSSFVGYAASYNTKDSFLLKLNFKTDWYIKWNVNEVANEDVIIPKGWSIKLGDEYYELPTAEELYEGKLMHHQNVQKLLNLKERLLEEIETYETYISLSPQLRKSVNLFTLYTIPEVINKQTQQ